MKDKQNGVVSCINFFLGASIKRADICTMLGKPMIIIVIMGKRP